MTRNALILTAAALASASLLSAASDVDKRLDAASSSFKEVMGTPDKSIPGDLLSKAQCVIVVPGLKKGAFIVGAKYGRGFVSCRKNGNWSAPGGVKVEGGSFGFQLGGSETDVFMLVMNQKGVDRLLASQFTIGGDASAAAGPVGRSTQAETDAAMTAEILTWSRSRGLFAGISLSGATMRQDEEAANEMYGKKLTNKEIITGDTAWPKVADNLHVELNKYSHK
jgi:lipid-binding SYLF domain-containing protein